MDEGWRRSKNRALEDGEQKSRCEGSTHTRQRPRYSYSEASRSRLKVEAVLKVEGRVELKILEKDEKDEKEVEEA